MLAMYLLGTVVALLMAWLFKKTLLRGEVPLLIMELPPYKMPVAKVVLRHMWDRSKLFLRRAGTVILGISILLWFLATYPRHAAAETRLSERRSQVVRQVFPEATTPEAVAKRIEENQAGANRSGQSAALSAELERLDKEARGEQLRQSFAGYMGRAIEPAVRPLGWDWRIGMAALASFPAREVVVGTLGIIYHQGKVETDEIREAENPGETRLARALREATWDDSARGKEEIAERQRQIVTLRQRVRQRITAKRRERDQ